jgi:hypothetical protein
MQAKLSTMSRKTLAERHQDLESKSRMSQVSLSQLSHWHTCILRAFSPLVLVSSVLWGTVGAYFHSPSTPVFHEQLSVFLCLYKVSLCVVRHSFAWLMWTNDTLEKSEEIVAVTVARRWLIAHMHQLSPRVIPDRSRKGLEWWMVSWKTELDRIKGWLESISSVVRQFIIVNCLLIDASFVLGSWLTAIVIMPIFGEPAHTDRFGSLKDF